MTLVICLSICVLTMISYVWGKLPMGLTALLSMVAFILTGCLKPATAVGYFGNAIVPVLKVTANARTYQKMEDNMDVDLSAIISGEKTYQEMGAELVKIIEAICNGRLTKAEAYGFSDVAVDHVCRFV